MPMPIIRIIINITIIPDIVPTESAELPRWDDDDNKDDGRGDSFLISFDCRKRAAKGTEEQKGFLFYPVLSPADTK